MMANRQNDRVGKCCALETQEIDGSIGYLRINITVYQYSPYLHRHRKEDGTKSMAAFLQVV